MIQYMNNKLYKIYFTLFSIFALVLFAGRGFSYVSAQTTTTPQITSDFKHDVEAGVEQVKNDKDAQNNQQEIDNEDNERAGDSRGDSKEIDGENNQSKIDNEIEQEVETEQEIGNQDGENGGRATSTSDTGSEFSSGSNEGN
jgi:hypothetical protein